MADNVVISAGTGTTVLADELTDSTLGTGKAQYVKILDATLDSSNKLIVDSSGRAQVAVGAALPAGTAVIGHVISDTGSTTAVTGNVTAVQATGTNLHVVLDTTSTTAVTQATGTNLHTVVDSGTITTVSAVTAITNALPAGTNNVGFVTPTPGTTGGWSKVKYAAQTTTVQTVKATAGNFGGYFIYNPNSSVAYLQVFDVATATTVTLGTTVPDLILGIPATSGANWEIVNGIAMVNGIKLAVATTATGLTAPATGLDMTILFK